METATRRSRWNRPTNFNVHFGSSDLEICKLLCPGAEARRPWGYQYLPSSYFAPLLERGAESTKDRLLELRSKPYFLTLGDFPKSNYRQFIYRLGPGGIDELETNGFQVELSNESTPHKLFECLSGASFELASKEFGEEITLLSAPKSIHPDGSPFLFREREVFRESDMNNATNRPTKGIAATSSNIAGKFKRYMDLVAHGMVKNPFFGFYTCAEGRVEGWIETLIAVIDEFDYDQDYADLFGFMYVPFNKYAEIIPPLSSWAATGLYTRPGRGKRAQALKGEQFNPFNLTQPRR